MQNYEEQPPVNPATFSQVGEVSAAENGSPREDAEPKRMLLHACCGPCTLEPSRLLREEGFSVTVYYANSNIWPREEYLRRGDTLRTWAATDGLEVIEGEYRPEDWAQAVAEPTAAWRQAGSPADNHPERCRACYRQRLMAAAAFAAENGYRVLATTLSVSPYQHTAIIREETERAAAAFGLEPHFEDFRPNYDEATRRSRALGMYRQNYCGCALSMEEAKADRDRIKAERAAARAQQRAAFEETHAQELAAAQEARQQRLAQQQAYDAKQARKREVLRQLRQQAKDSE